MDDLISRQAAINAMCEVCSDWCDEGVCKKVSAIQKLPPAQPERKTGKWIEDEDEMRVICSKCGEPNYSISDFCPNCGADMRDAERREG